MFKHTVHPWNLKFFIKLWSYWITFRLIFLPIWVSIVQHFFTYRGAIPQELHVCGEDHLEALVPCLRSHLPPALWLGHAVAGRGPSQHFLQTLHLLCAGEWALLTHVSYVLERILIFPMWLQWTLFGGCLICFLWLCCRNSIWLTERNWPLYRSWLRNWQQKTDRWRDGTQRVIHPNPQLISSVPSLFLCFVQMSCPDLSSTTRHCYHHTS